MNFYQYDIRVRYAETDQMGVSYYSNHFVWFEISRTEYFRALGLPYTEYEKQGIFLPVGEAYCRYHKPVVYDDIITVTVWVSALRRTSIQFSYSITKKGEQTVIAEGHTTHVFVDRTMKPCRIPGDIRTRVAVIDRPENVCKH